MHPPTQIEKLEELIKKSINGDLVEQTVETLVGPGENYGSVLYKVDFKVKNGGKIEIFHGVAKCTHPSAKMQELLNIQVTMKSEIAWYTTVIPTIRNFQRDCGIEQVADFFQHFYGARINLDPKNDTVDNNAVIFTENLNTLGYTNIDRHIGFDLKTSKAILRNLATFHAVPIAIKMKNKDLFDKNIKPYLPGFQTKENSSSGRNDNLFNDIKEAIKNIPEISPYIDRIVNNIKNRKLFENKLNAKEPWASVCHNDFWINNIMIKDGDNPKTVFLDFQMPAYASIATDLINFINLSVALEVVSKHMDELIKYYWDEFLLNLKQFHIDISIFPYADFLKEIDDVASSGLFGRTLLGIYLILQDKDSKVSENWRDNFESNSSLNDKQMEKYTWLILEYVKRRWI